MKTRLLAAFLLLSPALALAQDQTNDPNLSRVDIKALVQEHDDAPSVPGTVAPTVPQAEAPEPDCSFPDCFGQRSFNERLAGDDDAAIRDCDEGLRQDPTHAGILQVRAMAYTDQGDYTRALADIENAIKFRPKDGLSYYVRGVIHFNMLEFDKVIDDETKAVALTPADSKGELAEAFTERAAAYAILKQDNQSMTDLNKSLGLAESPEAYGDRAILYARQGEYQRSIGDAQKAVAINPGYSNGYAILGGVYFETDQYAQALSFYQKNSDTLAKQVAARKNPVPYQQFYLSEPYTGIAACQLRLGDKDLAAASYKKAIALDPVWTGGFDAAVKKMPIFEFLPKGKAANQELVKLVNP